MNMKFNVPDEPAEEVRCPNCGKLLPLRKEDSDLWSTMRGFDLYTIIVLPAMVAILFFVAYILGCKSTNSAWNIGTAIVIALVPLVSLLFILIRKCLRDEKNRRKEFGYQVWMVSCECGNCFRIVRSTTMLPAEHAEDNAIDAEYEQNDLTI